MTISVLRKILLIILAISIFAVIYWHLIFPIVLENQLEKISLHPYFKSSESYDACISDRRHDGSETLLKNINDITLQMHLRKTINLIKCHTWSEGRVFIYISKRKSNLTINVRTSPMWNNASFCFRDLNFEYTCVIKQPVQNIRYIPEVVVGFRRF